MMGHSDWCDDDEYSLQAIKDNLQLFTPEILEQINGEVVKAGHRLVKKKHGVGPTTNKPLTETVEEPISGELHGRCDSFVVETKVHFPTDISLLYDAIRNAIKESAVLATLYGISGWRQSAHHIKQFKKQYRKIQILKHSTSKNEEKRRTRAELAEKWIRRSEHTLEQLKINGCEDDEMAGLEQYLSYARRLREQTYRRVILEEVIAHHEKIFSIFEPHTEWISKGKAGVAVELGLRVCTYYLNSGGIKQKTLIGYALMT